MSFSFTQSTDGECSITISGTLRKLELAAAQSIALTCAAADIQQTLIVLENFDGWSNQDDWSDTAIVGGEKELLSKIAIVGDPLWKDETLMFMGVGFRKVNIQFFASAQLADAKSWLYAES